MAVKKAHGHAVTSVLPGNSDASSVAPAGVQFPDVPGNQAGGGKGKANVNPTGHGKKY